MNPVQSSLWRKILVCVISCVLLGGLIAPAPALRAAPTDPEFWLPNGTVDAIAASGRTIYLGGRFTTVAPYTGGLVALDAANGANLKQLPRVEGSINAMVPDGAGGWYIGGSFRRVGGIVRRNLARINADGSVNATWDPKATNGANTDDGGFVSGIALVNNTVYVTGYFQYIGGQDRSHIAALNPNTGAATAWNPGADEGIRTLVVKDSTLYVGGNFTQIEGKERNRIAAINTTTGAVTNWNPNANQPVFALAINGATLYAGGSFTNIGGQSRERIAALNLSTGAATGWNPGANNEVDVLVSDGATIYAGGRFTQIGGAQRNYVAALNATTAAVGAWNPAPSGADDEFNGRSTLVSAITPGNGIVYIGGQFDTIGGQPRNYLAAVDKTTGAATSWDPNAGGAAGIIVVQGSTIYAGGGFFTMGGVRRNSLAALDLSTGAATGWNPDAGNSVQSAWPVLALAVSGGTVYAGGGFTTVNGKNHTHFAALDATTGAIVAPNLSANEPVTKLAASDSRVFIGGAFTNIGGATRRYLAAVDSAMNTVANWNPDPNGEIRALAISGDTVYAGGLFSRIGGQSRSFIAALEATSGNATAWVVPPSFIYSDLASIAISGQRVYIGHDDGIFALDATTGLPLPAWSSPILSVDSASLAASDTTIYSGAGDIGYDYGPPFKLAALDATTGAIDTTFPNADAPVRALLFYDGALYAGGDFYALSGRISPYFAVIRVQDPRPTGRPVASTEPASDITLRNARLNGRVNANGLETNVLFQMTQSRGEYGPLQSIMAIPRTVTGVTSTNVSAAVENLLPGETYFYRVVATNAIGATFGNEQSFTMPPDSSVSPGTLVTTNGSVGAPNSYFGVNASGFPANTALTVTINNTRVGNQPTDVDGKATFTLFFGPNTPPGVYKVVVSDTSSASGVRVSEFRAEMLITIDPSAAQLANPGNAPVLTNRAFIYLPMTVR
jgi:hypothetical protein